MAEQDRPAEGGSTGVPGVRGAEADSLAGGAPPKLELEHLTISYTDRKGQTVQAVDDVSLSVTNKPGTGELAVFLGPSGCGKSTVLKAVAGLLTPNAGAVRIDGQPVTGTGRDRGMVFQSYTSFAWRTVRQNVEYGLELQGMPAEQRKEQSLQLIEQVGLKDFADAYPKQLSGGMKQRVAIARTLINHPKVVLMDEPFGALDPQTRWGMQGLILDVLKRLDNTVLFVTHDLEEAVFLADVIFVLSHRPARLLHRIEVPYFAERDLQLKHSPEFKRVTAHLLDLLHSLHVQGNVRVGL
jgi:NitT/TauT family transport system ATP-binding protein